MKKTSLIISSSLALLLSPLAFAHFHYELPLKTTLQINAEKELTGLSISWTYDDELTALMFKDQKNVKKMGKKLMKDLDTLGYFTFLKLNDKSLNTAKVTDYELEEIKHADYKNLKLSFLLPLKKPVSLVGENNLTIRHEDANASAILYYDKPELLKFDKELLSKCKTVLKDKKDFEEGEAPQTVNIICE